MSKNAILIITAVVLIAGFLWVTGVFSPVPQKPVQIPEGIILFYGQGCPHCKIVDDFIKANKIDEKVKFSNMEVWYNKENQVIISQVAQKCGLDANKIGVPLLYDGSGKCIEGDVDTINFFKNAAGIK